MDGLGFIALMDFESFPKIGRLSKPCVITEKLDGTNAQIYIVETEFVKPENDALAVAAPAMYGERRPEFTIFAGSRNRWVQPGKQDNYGFATWVQANAEELLKLGPGRHYGEWWGQGIQRGYNQDRKRFSLFNVHRWGDTAVRPACCDVVPVLYEGIFNTVSCELALSRLEKEGSVAAPGFMQPEGIIVYHSAQGVLFKKTFDDGHKGV
jgi:hypothetical protein